MSYGGGAYGGLAYGGALGTSVPVPVETIPEIRYQDVGLASASTLLFNRVEGQATGGVLQIADDLTSQAKFGIRTLSLQSLENADDSLVLTLCQFYVRIYSKPEVRFDTIGVELLPLDAATQALLASLDIGSVVMVERNPPGGGATITQLSMVEKIDWSLDASTGTCKLILGLQNIEAVNYFVLDDPVFGVLDRNVLF